MRKRKAVWRLSIVGLHDELIVAHIAALRLILMTYHCYSPDLGYVQGMSDLLSPIYVVFDSNEADAFWGLVGIMKMMVGIDLGFDVRSRTSCETKVG